MLTNIFNKTRPMNYLIVIVLLFIFLIIYQIFNNLLYKNWQSVGYFSLCFLVITTSILLVNFITLRNNLTKNNNFSIALFFIFLLFFPKVFEDSNILFANFFVLLAIRRLISIKSMLSIKEKLFDASLWIFTASLLHFWCIIYISLVFVSIMFYVASDYRNWFIPIIVLFTIFILFSATNLFLDNSLWIMIENRSHTSFDFSYFENIWQNIAMALFSSVAIFFVADTIINMKKKPLNMQSSHKMVLFSFVLGVGVYIFSSEKSNSHLIFCLTPLTIMGGNSFENFQNNIVKEIVFDVLLALGLLFFITAL